MRRRCGRAGLPGRRRRGCPAWRQSGGMDCLGSRPRDRCTRRWLLDRAMPALQRLREIAATQTSGSRRETLTFWTPRGLLRLDCRVEPSKLPGGNAHGLRVQALEAVAPAGARGPAAKPNGSSADLDVALDAWLAHELRTPLSAVIAYAEILKQGAFRPARQPALPQLRRATSTTARGMRCASSTACCAATEPARRCPRWPSPTSIRPMWWRAA